MDALPVQQAEEHTLVAVDLGCGDGIETLALLARGWTVIAVDAAPEHTVEALGVTVR